MMDFKKFSYWSGNIEGKGCSPSCQGDLNGLALDRVYNWEGWTKEMEINYLNVGLPSEYLGIKTKFL